MLTDLDKGASMTDTITIAARFNGPPTSGNGGYSAGLLAPYAGYGAIKVQLRAPPPLDTPLTVHKTDKGAEARNGETVVVIAAPAEPLAPPPAPPTPSLAVTGRGNFISEDEHVFPTCFVCGPHRHEGDGLRIFSGPLDGFEGVGDVWTPDKSLANQTGLVGDEFLWAALDCPGAFAIGNQENPMVLGQMTAQIHRQAAVGEPLTILGWHMFDDGRKHGAGTAIYRADGTCIAQSEQVWIELKPKAA